MMFSRVEYDCSFIEDIGNRFRAVADFYSVFFNAVGTTAAGAGCEDMLAELLQSPVTVGIATYASENPPCPGERRHAKRRVHRNCNW